MSTPINRLDWDNIKIFLAISRAGTLRRAAEDLNVNHATLARRLTTLEEHIDTRLFDRTKTGLGLTAIGQELLPHALNIENEIAAASRIVTGRDQKLEGAIHFSLPPSAMLSPISDYLTDFSQSYPEIDIHLHLSNSFADLNRREADVSLRYVSEVNDDVVGRRVITCTKAVFCSPEYAKTIKDNGGEGLHWIGWGEEEGTQKVAWTQNSAFPKANLRHRANEVVPQLQLAKAGLGLTMLPCFIADHVDGLVRAPYSKSLSDRSLWLLLHGDLRTTGRIRIFVDYLAERILADRALYAAK